MENLPDLPLQNILDQLRFQDVKNLLHTPTFRNMLISYFSVPINKKKLLTRTILECIDEFEKDLNTNLFFELLNFFEEEGFIPFQKTKAFQNMISEFLGKIHPTDFNLIRQDFNVKNKKQIIQYILENFIAISQIRERLDLKTDTAILDYYENTIEKMADDHQMEFYNKFTKSFENVLRYLEAVIGYMNEYLDEEEQEKNKFTRCLEKRQNFIEKMF